MTNNTVSDKLNTILCYDQTRKVTSVGKCNKNMAIKYITV